MKTALVKTALVVVRRTEVAAHRTAVPCVKFERVQSCRVVVAHRKMGRLT